MRRLLFAIGMVWILSGGATLAEMWPPLADYAADCVLIVKARQVGPFPEGKLARLTFEVLETWKGRFDPAVFIGISPEGYIYASKEEHGVHVKENQEIIFFFTRHNQPGDKLSHHSTAFPIESGRVVYASTGWDARREMTSKDFRREIEAAGGKAEGDAK